MNACVHAVNVSLQPIIFCVLCESRFTWDVIKKHRRHRAIVLTTHSMEEADVLCDRIAIMVEGRLAAVGTSLDLKSQFGVGYTLTVVKTRQPHNADAGHHIAR